MTPRVSHVEWFVTDLARSAAFLTGLFGWQFATFSTHYRLYTPDDGGTCVGLMEVATVQASEYALAHIEVANLEAYLARAAALGAPLKTPPTVIPGYGRYAQILDPDGHAIGLFTRLRPSESS